MYQTLREWIAANPISVFHSDGGGPLQGYETEFLQPSHINRLRQRVESDLGTPVTFFRITARFKTDPDETRITGEFQFDGKTIDVGQAFRMASEPLGYSPVSFYVGIDAPGTFAINTPNVNNLSPLMFTPKQIPPPPPPPLPVNPKGNAMQNTDVADTFNPNDALRRMELKMDLILAEVLKR